MRTSTFNSSPFWKMRPLATTEYNRSSCFRTTVEALEKEFYNQTRYVSELWRNLQAITKMSDSDISKMDQFYREVQKIVNELEMLFPDSPKDFNHCW